MWCEKGIGPFVSASDRVAAGELSICIARVDESASGDGAAHVLRSFTRSRQASQQRDLDNDGIEVTQSESAQHSEGMPSLEGMMQAAVGNLSVVGSDVNVKVELSNEGIQSEPASKVKQEATPAYPRVNPAAKSKVMVRAYTTIGESLRPPPTTTGEPCPGNTSATSSAASNRHVAGQGI